MGLQAFESYIMFISFMREKKKERERKKEKKRKKETINLSWTSLLTASCTDWDLRKSPRKQV